MDIETSHFQVELHSHILKLLAIKPYSFQEILERSDNCDPLFLLESLHILYDYKRINKLEDNAGKVWYFLPQKEKGLKNQKKNSLSNDAEKNKRLDFSEFLKPIMNSLPEASPIYSQWWFSNNTYGRLIRLIKKINNKKGRIGFIGSSTLGSLFSHYSEKPVHIFDVDQQLLKSLKNHCSPKTELIEHDISNVLDDQFKAKFHVVFVDPPWSSNSFRAFFIKTSEFVATEGKLAISFPQRFTRPSAEKERKDLLNSASDYGLTFERILPNFTEYSVPLFEYRAYKKSGISLEKPWRKGDLFVFTKNKVASKKASEPFREPVRWDQFRNNKFRLFLKRDSLYENGSPKIEPLTGFEDFTYNCTSSRTSAWKSASIVSSQNHVAHAYGRKKLSAYLEHSFKKSVNKINYPTINYHQSIDDFVFKVLRIERQIV